MSAGGERTEPATPKRREEARGKGQVARSADFGGAVVVGAGLAALAVFGPAIFARLEDSMRATLALAADPDVVTLAGLGSILGDAGLTAAAACAPVALACLVAGVVTNVAQVGLRPTPKALRPQATRINPLQGAKNLLGANALVETVKSLAKVAVVGSIAALALFPKLPELAALVGIDAAALGGELSHSIFEIALKATVAYLVIGAADLFWQRHRHEKQLRMTKDEVKREAKDQQLPPELRAALRQRQRQAARARMMSAVPGADVVVTNPTHFAVALSYDGSRPAPAVVAKGQDLVAHEIRRVAEQHGVAIVPDPPLARSLHSSVEIGEEIPEALYQAVAQLLAFVYRTAGRRAAG